MIDQPDDAFFPQLTAKISKDRGFGCASYKEKCLRRRIAVRMRAKGVLTYEAYAKVLDTDAAEYERLLDALTINVTKLFRNWDTYAAIASQVIPPLWSSPAPVIRVWSAGCSSGEEPYSIATLFHRHATDRNASPSRVRVLGTDIDRESLGAAARGAYEEAAFADTPAELRTRYFGDVAPYRVSPEVRALVSFERRDLVGEDSPDGSFHLIACRNVLIYFDRATQEGLFEKFFDALHPGGYLVLGKVETLLGPIRNRFAPVDSRERIFRKP